MPAQSSHLLCESWESCDIFGMQIFPYTLLVEGMVIPVALTLGKLIGLQSFQGGRNKWQYSKSPNGIWSKTISQKGKTMKAIKSGFKSQLLLTHFMTLSKSFNSQGFSFHVLK